MICWLRIRIFLGTLGFLLCGTVSWGAANVQLEPATTEAGYLARLMINEVPFPGERFYRSETDTQRAMVSILWVLHNRMKTVPAGYRVRELAGKDSDDIIDIITVGGVRGQVDGFYRDKNGHFVCVPRVHKRVKYLTSIGNKGDLGRVARLLNYGQTLASHYIQAGPAGRDYYMELTKIGTIRVTGGGYAWMTDRTHFSPGGNFIGIPNHKHGAMGGNRFFTLRKSPQ